MVEIFRDEHLLGRFVDAGGAGGTLVVTFASFVAAPALEAPGFGEAFCRKYGLDAVHVTASANHWYQKGAMPELLEAIRRQGARYATIVTYGASMGGYQALRAAGPLGASRTLAIGPQYSVDPARVPWERRWIAERAALTFREEELRPAPGVRTALIYDPWEPFDRRHADEVRARLPAREVKLPFAGHRIMRFLREAGLLSGLVRELLGVAPDAPGLRSRVRAIRRTSPCYFLGVAATERLPLAWREQAMRTALDLTPGDAGSWLRLASLLISRGDFEGAREAAARGAAMGANEVMATQLIAKAAARSGDWAAAAEGFERVLRLDPGHKGAQDHLQHVRARLANAAGSGG